MYAILPLHVRCRLLMYARRMPDAAALYAHYSAWRLWCSDTDQSYFSGLTEQERFRANTLTKEIKVQHATL